MITTGTEPRHVTIDLQCDTRPSRTARYWKKKKSQGPGFSSALGLENFSRRIDALIVILNVYLLFMYLSANTFCFYSLYGQTMFLL